jgi:glutamine synthetase
MDLRKGSMGHADFVERHGLWGDDDFEAASRITREVESHHIEVVRLSFADQHGVLRGKTIIADGLDAALRNGCTLTTTLLVKDTAHRTVTSAFTKDGGIGLEEMSGAGDFVMVPDPKTFRILPWAPDTGWLLCDIYFPNGKPVPFSTRQRYRDALAGLADAGYDFVAGLEIEFHLLKLEDRKLTPEHATQPATPPDVSLLTHGFQYLTENRMDEIDPILQILRRDLLDLGLPLRTVEVEYGPSQVEMTFHPGIGMEPADNMVLFRGAVKQISRRHGYHASFMCRPGLPNLFSSGWHLHQSLRARDADGGGDRVGGDGGDNAFIATGGAAMSPLAEHYAAGLLEHAAAASVFTTPTINGYKRFQPYSLAPDRAIWGHDDRGVMIRAVGGPGDPATRLENRVGDPAANPYLYMASQIICGLDGIDKKLPLGPPAEAAYETPGPKLPRSLWDAMAALDDSALFRKKLGDQFVDYILKIKQSEVSRFLAEVTDWEQREYFSLF